MALDIQLNALRDNYLTPYEFIQRFQFVFLTLNSYRDPYKIHLTDSGGPVVYWLAVPPLTPPPPL